MRRTLEPNDNAGANPQRHPEEQASGTDGEPKFGRLLVVLACAVAVIVALVFASAAWFGL